MNVSLQRSKLFLCTLLCCIIFSQLSFAQLCPTIPIPATQEDLRACPTPINPCIATGISLQSAILGSPGTCIECIPGEEITHDLIVTLVNLTESSPSISISTDITNATDTCSILHCSNGILGFSNTTNGDGIQTLNLGPINYTCGEYISLEDIMIVISTDEIACPLDCTPSLTNCSFTQEMLPVSTPLFCPLEENITIVKPCVTTNTGSITITAPGATLPYTYTASGTSIIGVDATFTDLYQGLYLIDIEDVNGCVITCETFVEILAPCENTFSVPCDDGDICTENDIEIIESCDGVTVCLPCQGTPVATCSIIQINSCDDNNPCTENDVETINLCDLTVCVPCAGTLFPDPGCDDGDCTNGIETWDGCNCIAGVAPVDPVCDDNDCSNGIETWDGCNCVVTTPFIACENQTSMPCDDNNPCTINDWRLFDVCTGEPCGPCTGDPAPDCDVLIARPCDDGNACTENDKELIDACNWEICEVCQGDPITQPVCDPLCETYNPATCSCDPVIAPVCNDADCSTIDSYDTNTCTCIFTPIPDSNCDDGLCYTIDYFDEESCKCVNAPINEVICDDNNCGTEDVYNYETCSCEHIPVCDNVENAGWIGYDQGNCGPFDPSPIISLESAEGGCGDIEYMWLKSSVNVPYNGSSSSPWTIIPGENDASYDPGFMTNGEMCFLRCARTSTCTQYMGESNIVCITVGNAPYCNDWDCSTEDTFNETTCECEYTPIYTPTCDDNDCSTEDIFNGELCECEHIPICVNVYDPGVISSPQESCGPFDPEPIVSVEEPQGGCGDIEYIWIMSNVDIFSGNSSSSPWHAIPNSNDPSYDPGYLTETTYFRRCARRIPCQSWVGESNIICIEVGVSENCDDGNCTTLDTYDPNTCECTHLPITVDCNDNNCETDDSYNALTCECIHTPITLPDCNDNDCTTFDEYDTTTCTCKNIPISAPDCDDNDCTTLDSFDTTTCNCIHLPITPPVCDDNDCTTVDSYDTTVCACVFTDIALPTCDDNDCNTVDQYNTITCECEYTPVTETACNDNDCNTSDAYDTSICQCVFTVIPPPNCDDNNCNTEDSYDASICACVHSPITPPDCNDGICGTIDTYDTSNCNCIHTPVTPPICDDNNCNTDDSYDSNTCTCIYTTVTPPVCDDNDCTTDDSYDTNTCSCVFTISQIPSCDDNNCNTNDVFNTDNCECEYTIITPSDCDDNNCNTDDSYNSETCTCINTPITPPTCDDNNCSTIDSYSNQTCSCVHTPIDLCTLVSDAEICLAQVGNTSDWLATLTAADVFVDGGNNCVIEDLNFTFSETEFPCNTVLNPVVVSVTICNASDNSNCCQKDITVTITDKTPPVIINCPQNTTVDCGENIDLNDLSPFGILTIFGSDINENCQGLVMVSDTYQDNRDNCGLGEIVRTFTATDASNNTDVCTQVITVINTNPLSESNFLPLINDIGPFSCNDLPNPEMLTINPTFNGCANATFDSFEEIIVDGSNFDDCTYEIKRVWVYNDECQNDPIIIDQIIEIEDTVIPIIDNVNDIVVDIESCFTEVSIPISVSDDCSLSDLAFSFYSDDIPGEYSVVDLDTNIDDGSFSLTGTFCNGLTEFELFVSDACGNVNSVNISVDINGRCGTPSCAKIEGLLNEDAIDTVFAEDFIIPFDNDPAICPYSNYSFSFDPTDINDTMLVVDCNSFGPSSGMVTVPVYFWLDGEPFSEGMSCGTDDRPSAITYSNFLDECGASFTEGNIAGRITSEDGKSIEDVTVIISGDTDYEVNSNQDGEFIFPNMGFGGTYNISAIKDNDHLNGISTLDIVLIQKHVLAIEKLDSPYKMIAADINKSNNVTARDIVELRKLILGIYPDFPDNQSWNFIDQNFEFTDNANPFLDQIPESVDIDSFSTNMMLPFIGVKIGDVNSSVINFEGDSSPTLRSEEILNISYDDKSLNTGNSFSSTFESTLFPGIQGFQFEIKVDKEKIENLQLGFNNEAILNNENTNIEYLENGIVRVSWNTDKIIEVEESVVLFELRGDIIQDTNIESAIALEQVTFKSEAYYNDMLIDIILIPKEKESSGISALKNQPNPWSEQTTVSFISNTNQKVQFRLFDMAGKTLRNIAHNATIGLNEITVSKSDIPTHGVLLYELVGENYRETKKMVIIR